MTMPFKPNQREYRAFANVEALPNDAAAPAYQVKGRAVVFDSPTCLFEMDGRKYYEVIDRNAFINCDMSDVIMNYNHSGKVVARLKNKTLKLDFSNGGLDITADLSGTEEGRKLYEEIRGGTGQEKTVRNTDRCLRAGMSTNAPAVRNVAGCSVRMSVVRRM